MRSVSRDTLTGMQDGTRDTLTGMREGTRDRLTQMALHYIMSRVRKPSEKLLHKIWLTQNIPF